MPARAGGRPGAPHAVDRVSEHAGSRLEHRVVRHGGAVPAARRQDQDSGELRHNLSQILEVSSLFDEIRNGVVVDFHGPLTLFTGAKAAPRAFHFLILAGPLYPRRELTPMPRFGFPCPQLGMAA